MLPWAILRASKRKKIAEGMQGSFRKIQTAFFHPHDQRFGVHALKDVPRRGLRAFAQGQRRRLGQGRVLGLQTFLEGKAAIPQGLGTVGLAGQQPQAVLRQPVFQQAGSFHGATGQ